MRVDCSNRFPFVAQTELTDKQTDRDEHTKLQTLLFILPVEISQLLCIKIWMHSLKGLQSYMGVLSWGCQVPQTFSAP